MCTTKKLSYSEYKRKKENIMVSSAPVEDKQKALASLHRQFSTKSSKDIATEQFLESAASTDDIGDHS